MAITALTSDDVVTPVTVMSPAASIAGREPAMYGTTKPAMAIWTAFIPIFIADSPAIELAAKAARLPAASGRP